MNKMLVAVFDNEEKAFAGLNALKILHKNGDISLYATAVIAKDADGNVTGKDVQDIDAGAGTALGILTGSFIGLLAGPAGAAAGAAAAASMTGMVAGAAVGSLSGMLVDLNKSGVDMEFVEDVSAALEPGKTAVLADIEEEWTIPVDTGIEAHGGVVFRKLRSEVENDQFDREVTAAQEEMLALDEAIEDANDETRASIHAKKDSINRKMKISNAHLKNRLDTIKAETNERTAALKAQVSDASEKSKAKIDKRIAQLEADADKRVASLTQVMEQTRDNFDIHD